MSDLLRIPVTEVLDEAADTVRTLAAPWLGVLWLGVLPLRLLTVHFVLELVDARAQLGALASYLRGLAWLLVLAGVVATLARGVFARACHLAMGAQSNPGRDALRLTPAEAAACLLPGLAALVMLHAAWFTVIAVPIVAILLGIGIALAHDAPGPGIVDCAQRIARAAGASRLPVLLGLVLGCAWILTVAVLVFGSGLVLWMLEGISGADLGPARAVMSPLAPQAAMLFATVALALVEPFWIAANVSFVRRLRASETGEDLRARLARLSARRAAA